MNATTDIPIPLTLASLALAPRWVSWQTEERAPGEAPTKLPYNPKGKGKAAANRPATWGTRAQAETRAATLPKPHGAGGIGLMLGDMGDGCAIGGIDLDSCRDDAGVIADWATAIIDRFGAYAEVSPSGTGIKAFFTFAFSDLPALRDAMGTAHGKMFKRPGDGAHPPAIELHLGNRYFATTFQHLAGTPDELAPVTLDTLLWLIRDAGPDFVKGAPSGPAEPKARSHPNGKRADKSRSASAFRKACEMRRQGADYAQMAQALRADLETADWAREKGDANGGCEMGRLYQAADPERQKRTDDGKIKLLINSANLPGTAEELRDHLATRPCLFDRGVPVRLAFDAHARGMVASPLGTEGTVREAHRVVQPWKYVKAGDALEPCDTTLPDRVARLYLDMKGEWKLRVLNGIASAPLLRDDGAIHATEGYDEAAGMWCEAAPDLAGMVPDAPTKAEAATALMLLRRRFRTFAFADAEMVDTADSPVPVVNLARPPGADESAFLAGLLTGVCRPSLTLAPALLLTAPKMSGAGSGKGLLARCICAIAFGRAPHAVTGGSTAEELEKRIAAELMAGGPSLFLDNLNAQAFKSDLLASAITERPARVRLLGKSEMVPLNATALVLLTGNGLTVSEDLARRFLTIEFDPQTEDPEARPFVGDVLAEVTADRAQLLAAALTVWRWGRITPSLPEGRPLNSFGQWGRWCRDPLLALGCADPAERIAAAKAKDTRRQEVGELFAAWWERHHDLPMRAALLHDDVRAVADPQNRGRQFLASKLEGLAGTRMAGFVLSRQAAAGRWGSATYALKQTGGTR